MTREQMIKALAEQHPLGAARQSALVQYRRKTDAQLAALVAARGVK